MTDRDWSAVPGALVTAEQISSGLRIIGARDFLALWKPSEIAAMIFADPLLLAGCLKVLAQGSANLDSPETASLLSLAVSKGLPPVRAAQIAAGTPPPAT